MTESPYREPLRRLIEKQSERFPAGYSSIDEYRLAQGREREKERARAAALSPSVQEGLQRLMYERVQEAISGGSRRADFLAPEGAYDTDIAAKEAAATLGLKGAEGYLNEGYRMCGHSPKGHIKCWR